MLRPALLFNPSDLLLDLRFSLLPLFPPFAPAFPPPRGPRARFARSRDPPWACGPGPTSPPQLGTPPANTWSIYIYISL